MASVRVPAIYENGVFRPLGPIEMDESVRVDLIIDSLEQDPLADLAARLRAQGRQAAWALPVDERRRRQVPLSDQLFGSFRIADQNAMRVIAEDSEYGLLGDPDDA